MAEIILGIGTSHSPLLAIDPSLWAERGRDDERRKEVFLADGRVVSYGDLLNETGGRYADRSTIEVYRETAKAAQDALDSLADEIERADPDVLLIVGDDQEELFSHAHMPAMAIYTGEQILMHPKNQVSPNLPEWYREANIGYLMDRVHTHPGQAEMATLLVEALTARGVDLSIARSVDDPEKAGFGHAYGFVIDRLLARRPVPVLPVMLNTYYPPNVPTPRRAYEVGRHIAAALADLPPARVCIVASGGLTHFATDEVFDRRILDALAAHDVEMLSSLPVSGLRSGNSEILNWVMAAGALEALTITDSRYLPVHRTPAGTGIGLAFTVWHP